MSVSKKFRTCSIISLLLISSLSILIIPENALAEDEEDPLGLDGILEFIEEYKLFLAFIPDALQPNPYKFLAEYYHMDEDPLEIEGDMEFDLYFTSNFFTQLNFLDYKDSINITVYSIRESLDEFAVQADKIENANASLTLNPEVGEEIQKFSITLEDINHTLNYGDALIFSIEIMQSQKPTGKFVEQRFERKLKARLEKLGNRLNQSSNPEVADFGGKIKVILDLIDSFDISGAEVAQLVDTFISTSLVYGSEDYSSSVFFKTKSEENITLYFENYMGYNDPLGIGQVKTANESISENASYSMWPPTTEIIEGNVEEGDTVTFIYLWFLYILEGIDGIDDDENKVNYYLTSENILDPMGPEASKSTFKLGKDKMISFEGPEMSRNKIIKSAKADLYLYFPKTISLAKAEVQATLKDNNETIGKPVTMQINRTKALEILQGGPNNPTTFEFEITEGYEIEYGHKLNLEVVVTKKPLLSIRRTRLVCGAEYPSNLYVEFEETTHINMSLESDKDQYVVPGGTAEFILNINSKKDDKVSIDVLTSEYLMFNESKWVVEHPEFVDIEAGGSELVTIYVTSIDPEIDAEGDLVNLTFVATGTTGIDSLEGSAKVDVLGVEYDTIVTAKPTKQEVKHGDKAVYKFTAKHNNTGVWEDTYKIEIESEHNFDTSYNVIYDEKVYESDEFDGVYIDVREEFIVNVTVDIPAYTDIKSDKLQFSVRSRESGSQQIKTTINVTTTIIAPNALEQFYHIFESLAERIGLDTSAAPVLIFAAAFLLFIIIVILFYIFKKKYVEIICVERIKEITPDEDAKFEITIRNPTKKEKTYEIQIESEPSSEGLDVRLQMDTIVVASKESKIISLLISPNDNVKADDWIEVKVTAKAVDKRKSAKISTVTTIKDAKKDVQIYGVFHWPRVFKKGERVETSFKLQNRGNVSAENITVILKVNGREKNKVEKITIPRGGYAEIEIPWIAVKGKNDVDIVVK